MSEYKKYLDEIEVELTETRRDIDTVISKFTEIYNKCLKFIHISKEYRKKGIQGTPEYIRSLMRVYYTAGKIKRIINQTSRIDTELTDILESIKMLKK